MHFSVAVCLLPFLSLANALNLAEIKQRFDDANIPSDLNINFNPSAKLFVTFPQRVGGSLTIDVGMDLPLNSTDGPPLWSVRGAGHGPFVIAAVDPDTPTPMNTSLAQVRHFLGNGLAKNTDSSLLRNSTPAFFEYIPPFPPAGSPAHRYVFLLFKEPAQFAQQSLVNSTTSMFNWDIAEFAKQTNLGDPIAGTFMTVAPDN